MATYQAVWVPAGLVSGLNVEICTLFTRPPPGRAHDRHRRLYLQIYVRSLLEERLRAVVGVVEYPGALHGDCGRRPGAGFATVLTAAPRPRLGCGVIHGPGPLVAGPSVGPPARLPMLIGWVTAVPVKAQFLGKR